MENLAGNSGCDLIIREELTQASIIVSSLEDSGEVPASIMGILRKNGTTIFTFVRAWYYWKIEGSVPLEVAKIIYANPIGEKDVRVAGHCGCPPPEEWAFPKKEVLLDLGVYKAPSEKYPLGQSPTNSELAKMCNSGEINEPRFVEIYHIDSQEGLNLFVKTMREHGLVD